MNLKSLISAVPAAAVLVAAAPAAALAAPATITSFTISPSCAAPSSTVSATATVQNNTAFPLSFYSQSNVTEGGVPVYSGGATGPYGAPAYVPVTQSQKVQIPWYTPWGYYSVNLGIGPSSSDPSSWSQRSATLIVSPVC